MTKKFQSQSQCTYLPLFGRISQQPEASQWLPFSHSQASIPLRAGYSIPETGRKWNRQHKLRIRIKLSHRDSIKNQHKLTWNEKEKGIVKQTNENREIDEVRSNGGNGGDLEAMPMKKSAREWEVRLTMAERETLENGEEEEDSVPFNLYLCVWLWTCDIYFGMKVEIGVFSFSFSLLRGGEEEEGGKKMEREGIWEERVETRDYG